MYRTDLYFKTDPELAAIAMDFAQDESLLLATVAEAWQLLMNADMFSGSQVGWARIIGWGIRFKLQMLCPQEDK